MISTFLKRNQEYRRRLFWAAPFAAAIVGLLFLGSDQISIEKKDKQLGWKGDFQVMPDITIVPDENTTVSFERQRKLRTMTTIDLDIEDGDKPDAPQFENVKREDDIEQLDFNEWKEHKVRTIKKSRDVPYSKDYVIIKMVEPEYPLRELSDGIEGNVLVELFVNSMGEVEDVEVISVIGPKSFEVASVKAVRQFIFQPPIENGSPATMSIRFNIRFRLSG